MGPEAAIQSAALDEYVAERHLRTHRLDRAAFDPMGRNTMRRIIGAIGVTLAVAAAIATSAAPVGAIDSQTRQLVDNLDIFILPFAVPD
jgi:hypothetical protein